MNVRAEERTRLLPSGRQAAALGILGAAVCVAGWLIDPGQFARSYLLAFLFWIGIAVGCLAVLLVQYASGGRWGAVLVRFLEAGSGTLVVMALAFVPVLLEMRALYVWARPEAAADPLLHAKHAYLNTGFFVVRAIVFFALWIGAATLLVRWSRRRERDNDPALTRKLQYAGAPGLVMLGITFTFALIDWAQSLEPTWYSTVYSAMVAMSDTLGAASLIFLVFAFFAERQPLSRVASKDVVNDLGNILLMFLMLGAYLYFSQFLLIWYANLPEETQWYARRSRGGWQHVFLLIFLLNFAVPFVLLLFRAVKKHLRRLALVAALLVGMRFVLEVWLITPVFQPERLRLHWLDFALPAGLGAVWLAVFGWLLAREPLLRRNDPRIAKMEETA